MRKIYMEFCQSRSREAGKIENDLKVIASQKIALGGCTIVHKFAQFLKQRFFHAAPALAGPGRTAQSAQKEAGLARRRGGGASARKGGQVGGHILRHSPSVGCSC